MSGNLFDAALMKTSVISEQFQKRYLSDPDHPNRCDVRAVVFEGPEDYHARINDPDLKIDENSVLVIRGCGPLGYPGAAEVVNMLPPDHLVKKGITTLPCIGDGRQSGTSASPSILNAAPEAAAGGGLMLLQTGDMIRIDIDKRQVNMLIEENILADRQKSLSNKKNAHMPESQTPWQELYRQTVGQLDSGGVIEEAVEFQDVVRKKGNPRHSH